MSTVSEPRAVRPTSRPATDVTCRRPPAPRQRIRHWSRLTWLLDPQGTSHRQPRRGQPEFCTRASPRPQTNAKSGAERTSTAHGVVCLGSVAIDSVPPDGVPLALAQIGEVRKFWLTKASTSKRGRSFCASMRSRPRRPSPRRKSAVRIAQGLLAEAQARAWSAHRGRRGCAAGRRGSLPSTNWLRARLKSGTSKT